MPISFILSPTTLSAKSSRPLRLLSGKGTYPEISSKARIGTPAVTLPMTGTCDAFLHQQYELSG